MDPSGERVLRIRRSSAPCRSVLHAHHSREKTTRRERENWEQVTKGVQAMREVIFLAMFLTLDVDGNRSLQVITLLSRGDNNRVFRTAPMATRANTSDRSRAKDDRSWIV